MAASPQAKDSTCLFSFGQCPRSLTLASEHHLISKDFFLFPQAYVKCTPQRKVHTILWFLKGFGHRHEWQGSADYYRPIISVHIGVRPLFHPLLYSVASWCSYYPFSFIWQKISWAPPMFKVFLRERSYRDESYVKSLLQLVQTPVITLQR